MVAYAAPGGALMPIGLSCIIYYELLIPLLAAQGAGSNSGILLKTGKTLSVKHMAAAQQHLKMGSKSTHNKGRQLIERCW